MLFQYTIIAAIIAMALAYLGQRAARTWRGRCSSGCGCKPVEVKKNEGIATESLGMIKR